VALSNSLHWKSGSQVEWSVDVESEIFAHSFGCFFLSFVNIDNIPSGSWNSNNLLVSSLSSISASLLYPFDTWISTIEVDSSISWDVFETEFLVVWEVDPSLVAIDLTWCIWSSEWRLHVSCNLVSFNHDSNALLVINSYDSVIFRVFLLFSWVELSEIDFLSLNICVILDCDNLILIQVLEVVVYVLEDLEPSLVGAPDLHVVCLTSTLDVKWLVVISGSNSQSLLMEVPFLSLSTISCLDDHVSVIDQVEVSVIS